MSTHTQETFTFPNLIVASGEYIGKAVRIDKPKKSNQINAKGSILKRSHARIKELAMFTSK